MQEFENYVKSNYNIPGATACAIKYTFTTRDTIDKVSKIPIIIYTIVMKMTWFDKCGQQLQVEKLIFVNDTLSKSSEKCCFTIAPSEVSNKFRVAKRDIIRILLNTKQQKIDELKQEQTLLTRYLGSESAIIPNEAKAILPLGTLSREMRSTVNVGHSGQNPMKSTVHIAKNKFEM
jgi:hypothetical protein